MIWNSYLIFIICVILLSYALETFLDLLNLRSLSPDVPAEFRDVYDAEKYAESQRYTWTTTRFSLVRDTISTSLLLFFIVIGGFNMLDSLARSFDQGSIVTGLIFMVLLSLLSGALSLPFSFYSTFVIEERFGFNKTTLKTFVLDLIKGIMLSAVIGLPFLAFILWFFETRGELAWVYCWIATTAFGILVQFVAPVLIMPLFNKFTPLEEGELKDEITDYADRERFKIKGIYTMDGSKRSSKANAFFTGFGKFRRIVFFDTLMEKLSTSEIVAVLAHEMGHFKLKHIFKMFAASVLQMGLMFYILSLFINNKGLFEAFGMEHLSIYASLIFCGFLYSPISTFLSLFFNYFSRKHEYEADNYVVRTIGHGRDLISGLKKLSVANLSNLTPHPWYVFVHYSHPPLAQRIRAVRGQNSGEPGGEDAVFGGAAAAGDESTGPKSQCSRCGELYEERQLNWSDNSDRLLCAHCLAEEESCGCADD